MENYVTLFNSLFLPQGLALHRSMEEKLGYYRLWILCVDDETHSYLEQLSLPNTCLLKLSSLETPELLNIKSSRTIGEYCWTLTPFAPRFVFESDPNVNRVTYLDADLWFRKNPKVIFDEFDASGKHVLITEHAFAPEYDRADIFGRFCVQFMTFTRNKGENVRKWWEDRCIEWCYSRAEDGKFGDQKYLDDWPERFASFVHVLRDKEAALAPWNATRFPHSNAVFFHFHGLRISSQSSVSLGDYSIPRVALDALYIPYLKDLRFALEKLENLSIPFVPQTEPVGVPRRIFRRMRSTVLKALFFSPEHMRL